MRRARLFLSVAALAGAASFTAWAADPSAEIPLPATTAGEQSDPDIAPLPG